MVIHVQRHANLSKQARLLDGVDVKSLKWRVYGFGLNRFVHEGMNHISNVKVHSKTRSGNVNIQQHSKKNSKTYLSADNSSDLLINKCFITSYG